MRTTINKYLSLFAVFSMFLITVFPLFTTVRVNAQEVSEEVVAQELWTETNIISTTEQAIEPLTQEELEIMEDAVDSYLNIMGYSQVNPMARAFGIPNWIVSNAINIGIAALTGTGSVRVFIAFIQRKGSHAARLAVARLVMKFVAVQTANRVAGLIIGAINGFLSFTIGDAVARVWDRNDRYANNNFCNALW